VIDQNIAYFNQEIKAIELLDFITRDDNLQREACARLEKLWEEVKLLKIDCAKNGANDVANLFLGFQCALSQLYNKLNMWLCLKTSNHEKAWDHLIQAQYKCRDAANAHKGFQHLSIAYGNLLALEANIFPPQVFLSSGLLAGKQVCSICKNNYEECDHIAGNAYAGQFCRIISQDITADHVALVESPADKRCRITSFANIEGVRNRMTWALEPHSVDAEPIPDGALHASSIIIVADDGEENI